MPGVEAAISSASKVYHPGEYERLSLESSRSSGNPLSAVKGEHHFTVSRQRDSAYVAGSGTPEDTVKIVGSFHSSVTLHRC